MPSLEWLINPIAKQVFFEGYWEKKPLVLKRNLPQYFSSLLSLDEVDRALTTLDLRYPNVTLKNADHKITGDDYTVEGDAIDCVKVYQLYGEGATIVLSYLDTVIPALAALCCSLESEFSFPFQTNVYSTPAGAKGFNPHYDTHDVFVLQISGSKHWTIYGTPVDLPLSEQDFDPSFHERGEPTLEFELEAGDTVYIPRGIMHDARSSNDVSLHITVGVLAYTWADIVLESVAEVCLSTSDFRKALPPGFARQTFDRTMARETFSKLLQGLPKRSNIDGILDRFIDEFISSCPPLLRGQMSQISKLDRMTIDNAVGARAGVNYHMKMNGSSAVINCYGRRIIFPADVGEAVRFALSRPQFAVRDLPGNLDDAGKLTLVRRLVHEGLLIVFNPNRSSEPSLDYENRAQ
jgi:ribosomal protein L16 Arg81 hydroxylase